MKRYLIPLVAVFLSVQASVDAVEPCTDDIIDITECPLEGCGPTSGPRPVDGKLNEQKKHSHCSRWTRQGDAWLLTVRRGVLESCNCKIEPQEERDNHMVMNPKS